MALVLTRDDGPFHSVLSEAANALDVRVVVASGPSAIDAQVGPDSCAVFDVPSDSGEFERGLTELRVLATLGARPIAIGDGIPPARVRELFAAGARDVISGPLHRRELILRLGAVLQRKVRIACIGGGTGLFSVLSGLRGDPRVLLGSIVTMSDDGGSSGRLRTSFGVLPPGDVRRSLVALSNAPEVMSYVMQYRFATGDGLNGHSLGNLLLTALSECTGGMQNAVKALGDVLNVQGLVMCVTEQATTLCAEFEDGRIVRGESAIDRCLERPTGLHIRRVWHEPSAGTNSDVLASLLAADVIVIGPGDLYTSVLAALTVEGVAEAVRNSKARRIYVCNLMTKPGETDGYDAADHVAAIVETIGADVLDYVIVSDTGVDPDAVRAYASKGQFPVALPSPERMRQVTRAHVVLGDVGDRARLVRHNPAALRATIQGLLRRRDSTAT